MAETLDDCWNRIGVQGDQSCARLPLAVHCRNCGVYAAAAKAVLDRLPPQEVALAPAPARTAAATLMVLVFRVGAEWLALPSRSLEEVAAVGPVHRLPHQRHPAILGLTNIRGTLTLCLSLAALLDLAGEPRSARPRMLIFGKGGRRLVLPVDEVSGIYGLDGATLEPLPTTVQYAPARFSRGLARCGGRLVGVLDDTTLMQALERCLA
ncbi:chemotaxis protein CheW [Bordetella hinzii]|uniref:Chemotaxis protein CheW n=2 Tax=Bordetella hinzii TaxID=103855 RepID=A0AAN1RXJ6_9BORD|nr:chemotaxis protein CheW [Bordetella hinzii]AKQ56705.1 CheW-like domain protein [Bordetella hinzii]AKQ61164.1 CheW-like domain protein [Bordetella hinzii]AZW17839.1 chemotaxis protein CheW [Bordetella hinzii]KCB22170.1 CheW-like protein [Bordetella hinzii OH87 BAL007II]KCB30895.1 CheW-like protein [Bordetella hinzii L60]